MALIESATVQCPCCWELIEIVVDCSLGDQSYVEDCEVCCRPMHLHITVDAEGLPGVDAEPANQ